MPIAMTFKESDARVAVKIWTKDVEATAVQQLKNIARLPFIVSHVAAMPDVHWGMGATVGSVLACRNAVIPAAVGVDLGCGMMAVRTNLKAEDLPDSLDQVRHSIERSIPVGFSEHKETATRKDGQPAFDVAALSIGRTRLMEKHPKIQQRNNPKFINQIGTLGGGNHFIELCLDKEGSVWIMLHSGSRNIGKVIAEYFITRAKEHMQRYFVTLPDADLAFLPDGSQDFIDYVEAVDWAQEYAMTNRQVMMGLALDELRYYCPQMQTLEGGTNCHHNYISRETHFGEDCIVTRKGAIRARVGELGIIPGSMGTRSFIVRGKGEPQSFESCSHGAGRRMSRGAAKRTFTLDDLKVQTHGVECRKDADVIDEIPGAYKPIDEVMENQTDLVDVVHELKQILCIKG